MPQGFDSLISGDLLEPCWALQAVASCVIMPLPAVYEAEALAVHAAASWEGRDPWKKRKSNKSKVLIYLYLINIQDSKLNSHFLLHHDAMSPFPCYHTLPEVLMAKMKKSCKPAPLRFLRKYSEHKILGEIPISDALSNKTVHLL